MASFSSWERSIAMALGRVPRVKRVAKAAYERLQYFQHKQTYTFRSDFEVNPVAREGSSFFGYYDKDPMNSRGQVLCHLTGAATDGRPRGDSSIRVAVFDVGDSSAPVLEVETKAFNWQQGARTQWVEPDTFIFNDFDSGKGVYCARVLRVSDGHEVAQFPWPVQDAFRERFYLSINYRRLMALRPDYGYRNLPALTASELKDLSSDGIWRVDLGSGEASMIYSLRQVCAMEPKHEFSEGLHKVNHLMISPLGSRFIFLHRYIVKGCRHDRLMLGTPGGEGLRVLVDKGIVSHCSWIDEATLLGYLCGSDGHVGYHVVNVESGVATRLNATGLDDFGDGHPHVVGDSFITDTYPDKARMQHLMLCNLSNGLVQKVGEFYHGFGFSGEARCDLHPRLSKGGRTVFFDSVFSGRRQMYRIDLS